LDDWDRAGGGDEFRRIGWGGQADANKPCYSPRIVKRGNDTDDRTVRIDEWSARIAVVDGSISLDRAVEYCVLQSAIQRVDYPPPTQKEVIASAVR
jgi:hypothetical protein